VRAGAGRCDRIAGPIDLRVVEERRLVLRCAEAAVDLQACGLCDRRRLVEGDLPTRLPVRSIGLGLALLGIVELLRDVAIAF
jgi:hypothetical protein